MPRYSWYFLMQINVDGSNPVELASGTNTWTCRNSTGTADIWLDTGPAAGINKGTVSPGTGFLWHYSDPMIVVTLDPDQALFAISNGAIQLVEAIKGVKFASSSIFVTGTPAQ